MLWILVDGEEYVCWVIGKPKAHNPTPIGTGTRKPAPIWDEVGMAVLKPTPIWDDLGRGTVASPFGSFIRDKSDRFFQDDRLRRGEFHPAKPRTGSSGTPDFQPAKPRTGSSYANLRWGGMGWRKCFGTLVDREGVGTA